MGRVPKTGTSMVLHRIPKSKPLLKRTMCEKCDSKEELGDYELVGYRFYLCRKCRKEIGAAKADVLSKYESIKKAITQQEVEALTTLAKSWVSDH